MAFGDWVRATWRVDIRDAWRALLRTPIQTATILVCLTLGSTLTVLMFGILNTMLSGTLPGVRDRDRLVRLGYTSDEQGGRRRPFTIGQFRQMPGAIPGLESFGGQLNWRFSTSVDGQAIVANGAFVTGNFFRTLGTVATAGRLIQLEDDGAGADSVAVISDAFSRRHFGGDRATALNSRIQIGTGSYRIVGVLPRGFVGLDAGHPGESSEQRGEIWLPMREMWIYPGYVAARVDRAIGPQLIARLETGLSPQQAEARAQAAVAAIVGSAAVPAGSPTAPAPAPAADGTTQAFVENPGVRSGGALASFKPFMLGADADEAPYVALGLMCVPFLVLGIACANVAGVQLARAVTRTHEIAIRVSLGASRRRVIRALAIETGIVSLASAALAWFVATRTLSYAANVLPFPVETDTNVMIFAALLPLGITLVAGLAPAWRATGFDVLSGLRLGPRVGRSSSRRLRRVVVAAQVSLSVVMLMAAGFLVRSVQSLPATIGPLRADVVTAAVSFSDLDLRAEQKWEMRTALGERVSQLAGVTSTAVTTGGQGTCWAGNSATDTIADMRAGNVHLMASVTANFFQTMDIQVRRGRAFSMQEQAGVVVINQAFADMLRRDTSEPLGATIRIRRVSTAPVEQVSIVGIVEDSYERAPRGVPKPYCYAPLAQNWADSFTLHVRSANPSLVIQETPRILQSMNPRLAPRELGTIEDILRNRYRFLRQVSGALAAAAGLALLLASVGLFGVMAHGASERAHEFGVRMALGARPGDIRSNVVRESLGITMTGAAIGFVASIPLATLFSDAILTSISWRDPVPAAIVVGVLVVVGMVATLVPALRIARIDPVNALRQN